MTIYQCCKEGSDRLKYLDESLKRFDERISSGVKWYHIRRAFQDERDRLCQQIGRKKCQH